MLVVFWIAIAFGFYMAWSIGANDAANSMGTSVGSGAVSFKEAVIIAAIFEFAGAFLAGADVTDTMRNGIINPVALTVLPDGGKIFALGMLDEVATGDTLVYAHQRSGSATSDHNSHSTSRPPTTATETQSRLVV